MSTLKIVQCEKLIQLVLQGRHRESVSYAGKYRIWSHMDEELGTIVAGVHGRGRPLVTVTLPKGERRAMK